MNRKEQIRNASKEVHGKVLCLEDSKCEYMQKWELEDIPLIQMLPSHTYMPIVPFTPWEQVSGIPYGKPTNKSVILEEYKAPEKPQDFTLHIDYTDSLPHDNIIPIKYIPSWLKTTNKNNKK